MPTYVTINGRQVAIPDAGISGSEIINKVNPQKKPGRRTTKIIGSNAEAINPKRIYTASELVDRQGRPAKFGDMPDRTKGDFFGALFSLFTGKQEVRQPENIAALDTSSSSLFWGQRSNLSKRIILEQCNDIGSKRFDNDVQIDMEGANTFVVNNYRLPSKWKNIPGVVNNTTKLAIVFPTDYPRIAPIGFYLKATITHAPNNNHFYTAAYHSADKVMLKHGWKWYCVYVDTGSWQPNFYRKPNDWRGGDCIWTYFDLIKEALSSDD